MRSHIHRKLSVTISAIGVAAGCLSGAIPSRTAAATAPDFILRTEVSADGHETAFQSSRPATEAERGDLSISPDGWVQETPRESYSRGTVPLPLVPDWVGGRPRANSSLLFCDADHDGDQDLVVGTYYANMYPPIPDYYNFIYLNNGGVLEATPSWLSADQKHTSDLAWGRINSDAYPDLFVANGLFVFSKSTHFRV